MSAWAFGVLASLAAALLVGVTGLAVRIWRQLSLRRLAYSERRKVRRLLAAHLDISRPGSSTGLSRQGTESLAGSFRLQLASRYELSPGRAGILNAVALLKHIAQHSERVYLINAESGYGKTIMGMTLSLLQPYEGLTPLYVDLAEADSDEPLVEIEQMLARLHSERDRKLKGRPLFVIDALNETVDPAYFCERLAARDDELRRLDAKLLFLFSFRHRSYPSRLRKALLTQKLGPLAQMELLFDLNHDRDLASFQWLTEARGLGAPNRRELTTELQIYGARFPPSSLSREDLNAYLEWRYSRSDGVRTPSDPEEAPAPANLRFARLIGSKAKPSEALDRLTEIALDLLSRETTAIGYDELAGPWLATEAQLRQWVSQSGLEEMVRCGARHLRFYSESTVRMLGALQIARKLTIGESPGGLRGRTAYDVCAPYLQSALRWELDNHNGGAQATSEQIADSILKALKGRDAPYSFYATALCSEKTGILGGHRDALDTSLFEQLIVAIDEDRAQSCRGSLEAAGQSEPQPTLDPVLDQLFEVMAAYGRQAVALLLATMNDPQPLVRSQAAYLLLDWAGNVPAPPLDRDKELLGAIPAQMSGGDGNLHFRFHQVEILEALTERFAHLREAPDHVGARLAEIAGANVGTVALRGVEGVYAECQQLVATRARLLVRPAPPGDTHQLLGSAVNECMKAIDDDGGFWELGTGAAVEARLECWEVTLGFAVHMCSRLRKNSEFTSFVETALEHPFWIVRWWAFAGLIGVTKAACKVDDRVLAARCARRAAERLSTGIEPMGLKHRQCALVKRLLADHDGGASRVMRTALGRATDQHLSAAKRQALAESYYEAMGASPDAYLSEFFHRLGEIAPGVD